MAVKKALQENMVKKETLYVAVFLAVVVGFFGGVIYSAVKSGPSSGPVSSGPAPQQQGGGISPEMAQRTLALEQEVAANPGNGDAWTQLGNVYFDSDRYDQAIRAYTRSLEIFPNNPDVLTDLGVMYRLSGQPNKAIEVFDKAISINPRHEQSRFNKGVVLRYDLDDRDGAIKAWEELLKVNPNAVASGGVPVSEAIKQL